MTEPETTPRQVHKVELMIVDHFGRGIEGIIQSINESGYPSFYMTVMDTDTKTVQWHDRHPLNLLDERREAYRELFKSTPNT